MKQGTCHIRPDSREDSRRNIGFIVINPLEYDGWDEFVLAAPNYSFFHSSAWARVLYESYRYTPTFFALGDNVNLVAAIPFMDIKSPLTGHRGVSLPFTDYCEPIASSEQYFEKMFSMIAEFGRKAGWRFMEMRGGNYFDGSRTPSQRYYRHSLRFPGKTDEEMMRSFRKGTRSSINKGIRDGVEVMVDESAAGIRELYRLNCMTRKKHGLPPQPYRFFQMVHEHAISRGHGQVFIASLNKRIIAAAVFLHIGKRVTWKYGASDHSYLRHGPNNVILWEAMKWYCRNGFESICFGRTSQANEGLRSFKNGWGTKEETVNYYRYDLKKNAFVGGPSGEEGLHVRVMKRLPTPLLRVAGSLLYKHMG